VYKVIADVGGVLGLIVKEQMNMASWTILWIAMDQVWNPELFEKSSIDDFMCTQCTWQRLETRHTTLSHRIW
jgi:hypothetical protein